MIAEMMLGTILVSAAGGAGYLVLVQKREREERERERLALRAQFRDSLVQKLRTRGASRDFLFSEHAERCNVPRADAERVAEELYLQLCRKVTEDGVITGDERKQLATLAHFLDLDADRASRLDTQAKGEIYRRAVVGALADGVVTAAEAADLKSLRASLGIGIEQAIDATDDLSRDAYLSSLQRIVDSGRITSGAKADLARLKQVLVLHDDDAKALIRDEAFGLYRRLLTFVLQDGVVTLEEEDALDWLQQEAGLSDMVVAPSRQKIADIRRYSEYRDGRLPVIATRLILNSGEICHWQGVCFFGYLTASKNYRQEQGMLTVTSKNLLFNSSAKTFSFSPSTILDISTSSDGVGLATSVRNGNGSYGVTCPAELDAILTGLVRKHKYLVPEGYSSSRTRHIPREVKVEVWSRDAGLCVNCRADDYLEFDHIIPYAKGGANTVGNVQLLCRRCNSEKRDRI